MENNSNIFGIVCGQTKPHYFNFVANRAVKMGEYVTVNCSEGKLLGLVEDSSTQSNLLNKVEDFQTALEARSVAAKNIRDKSYFALVRIVGILDNLKQGAVILPSVPPEPGSEVFEAQSKDIEGVFNKNGSQWIQVGSLLRNSEVRVSVNVDKIASRHLAIISVTGGGKSNLLALIIKKIAELKGTMVLFDYHGEYSELQVPGIIHIEAKINPRHIDIDQFADLIDIRENAQQQRTVLSKAFTQDVKESKRFWESLLESISKIGEQEKQYAPAATRLEDIIKMAMRRMGSLIDPDAGNVLDQIKPSRVNIMNMLEFTERQANAAISYYLEEILEDRKRAIKVKGYERRIRFPTPVICAIEEAHAFIGQKDSDAKVIASKIAREGRKFGVSLIVVSQRPRRLDQDVLSQVGSFAVMRLTNPEDQKHIKESSDVFSDDLLQNLPSLNPGEAVLTGEWVTVPSVVRIDHVREKRSGSDISATSLWADEVKMKEMARESTANAIKLE